MLKARPSTAVPWTQRKHALLRRYVKRARMLSIAEALIIILLAVDAIAVLAFGFFGVLPEARASLATAAERSLFDVARSLLNGEMIVVMGALVAGGRWLHQRLLHAMRLRAEAKVLCLLIKQDDPRVMARLKAA